MLSTTEIKSHTVTVPKRHLITEIDKEADLNVGTLGIDEFQLNTRDKQRGERSVPLGLEETVLDVLECSWVALK